MVRPLILNNHNYDNLKQASRVYAPVLILHGLKDHLVQMKYTWRLFGRKWLKSERLKSPLKKMIVFRRKGHCQFKIHEDIVKNLNSFLEENKEYFSDILEGRLSRNFNFQSENTQNNKSGPSLKNVNISKESQKAEQDGLNKFSIPKCYSLNALSSKQKE